MLPRTECPKALGELGVHLKAVGEEVRVGGAPGERPKLHDGDEARQVVHLALQIFAVPHAAQVEQLGACIKRHIAA